MRILRSLRILARGDKATTEAIADILAQVPILCTHTRAHTHTHTTEAIADILAQVPILCIHTRARTHT